MALLTERVIQQPRLKSSIAAFIDPHRMLNIVSQLFASIRTKIVAENGRQGPIPAFPTIVIALRCPFVQPFVATPWALIMIVPQM
jgi:hypothetical protein